jgi:hypothetical protein
VPVEGVDCGEFTAEDCSVMKAMEIDRYGY